MSAYLVDGVVKASGAHRPWLTASQGEPDRSYYQETVKMKAERETCLSCTLPSCRPESPLCPLRNYKEPPRKQHGGRKKMPIPAVFVKYGMNRTSNKEWAEHLGVSTTTIRHWRKELGIRG